MTVLGYYESETDWSNNATAVSLFILQLIMFQKHLDAFHMN